MSKLSKKTKRKVLDKARRMTQITNNGRSKKADRARRRELRRARQMLDRAGFKGIYFYNMLGINIYAFSRKNNSYSKSIVVSVVQDILSNKSKLFDQDNSRWYENAEEYLKEQLIIKLAGLEN